MAHTLLHTQPPWDLGQVFSRCFRCLEVVSVFSIRAVGPSRGVGNRKTRRFSSQSQNPLAGILGQPFLASLLRRERLNNLRGCTMGAAECGCCDARNPQDGDTGEALTSTLCTSATPRRPISVSHSHEYSSPTQLGSTSDRLFITRNFHSTKASKMR